MPFFAAADPNPAVMSLKREADLIDLYLTDDTTRA
jgi:hypothetical protein